MVKIKIIASGSDGNCTAVYGDEGIILFDCGIPVRRIRKGIEFRLSDVRACFISHEHSDHNEAAGELERLGVPIIRPSEDQHEQTNMVSDIMYTTCACVHDIPTSLYFVQFGGAKILYATDTAYIRERFTGMTHLIIECNYDEEILAECRYSGELNRMQVHRIMQSHMGLATLLDFLEANDMSKLVGVWIVHVSKRHADKSKIREMIMGATGVPVTIGGEK